MYVLITCDYFEVDYDNYIKCITITITAFNTVIVIV